MSAMTGTGPEAVRPRPLARRVWNVARLHLANPWATIGLPWLIFGAVFALNLAIWSLVTMAAGGRANLDPGAFSYNGGVTWFLFYFAVIAVQAINLTFHFALGLGVTRRDYFLGTLLHFALLAASFAVVVPLLALVETWTDGWGLGGRFFAPGGIDSWSSWQLGYVIFVAGLGMLLTGWFAGAVWVRWRARGLYAMFGLLALVVLGGAWLATVTTSWGRVGAFLAGQGAIGLVSWSLLAAVVLALASYLVLRRAPTR
jgi:hypothetical protein